MLRRKSPKRLAFGNVDRLVFAEAQLQKILGDVGVKTYKWMLNGLTAVRSVGVIHADGQRIGERSV